MLARVSCLTTATRNLGLGERLLWSEAFSFQVEELRVGNWDHEQLRTNGNRDTGHFLDLAKKLGLIGTEPIEFASL